MNDRDRAVLAGLANLSRNLPALIRQADEILVNHRRPPITQRTARMIHDDLNIDIVHDPNTRITVDTILSFFPKLEPPKYTHLLSLSNKGRI